MTFSLVSGKSSRKKLFSLLDKQKDNYEKEIQIIEKTAEEADKKKTEIFAEHIKEIERIEEEHDVRLEELERGKQEELVEILKSNKDRPDKLAEEIAKILSVEFLKKSE